MFIVYVCNTGMFKLIPVWCSHVDAYTFSIVDTPQDIHQKLVFVERLVFVNEQNLKILRNFFPTWKPLQTYLNLLHTTMCSSMCTSPKYTICCNICRIMYGAPSSHADHLSCCKQLTCCLMNSLKRKQLWQKLGQLMNNVISGCTKLFSVIFIDTYLSQFSNFFQKTCYDVLRILSITQQ